MIKKILTFLASIYCSALLLNYTEKYILAQKIKKQWDLC